MLKSFQVPKRSLVILPSSHPFEYFKDSWQNDKLSIQHPQKINADAPLYFKIKLLRSVIGLPWQKRYELGVLFKKYQPEKRLTPKSIKPRLSCHTVVFREASTEVADMIYNLKEVLQVENIWTTDQYRKEAKELLNSKALTEEQKLEKVCGYKVIKP